VNSSLPFISITLLCNALFRQFDVDIAVLLYISFVIYNFTSRDAELFGKITKRWQDGLFFTNTKDILGRRMDLKEMYQVLSTGSIHPT
jgi:hypothetical protein